MIFLWWNPLPQIVYPRMKQSLTTPLPAVQAATTKTTNITQPRMFWPPKITHYTILLYIVRQQCSLCAKCPFCFILLLRSYVHVQSLHSTVSVCVGVIWPAACRCYGFPSNHIPAWRPAMWKLITLFLVGSIKVHVHCLKVCWCFIPGWLLQTQWNMSIVVTLE